MLQLSPIRCGSREGAREDGQVRTMVAERCDLIVPQLNASIIWRAGSLGGSEDKLATVIPLLRQGSLCQR